LPAPASPYRIETLDRKHDRSRFSCGNEKLDVYLQRQASQDAGRFIAAPFVLVEPPSPKVIAYYALSSSSVELEDLPPDVMSKLPRYPQVPVTLLGRLAVDMKQKGRGLGELLLMDALRQSLLGAQKIGAMAVILDAIDEKAKKFYQHFAFIALADQPMRLLLPIKTIEKLWPEK
jgi:predicted GNAT family N-acyltransferase